MVRESKEASEKDIKPHESKKPTKKILSAAEIAAVKRDRVRASRLKKLKSQTTEQREVHLKKMADRRREIYATKSEEAKQIIRDRDAASKRQARKALYSLSCALANGEMWEVSEVLEKRVTDGMDEYKVTWVGFPSDETSWIRKDGMPPVSVREFNQKIKQKITFENDERQKAAIAAEIEKSGNVKVFIPICDICHSVLWKSAETRVRFTKCGHGTHTECFDLWTRSAVNKKPSCSKDRTELTSEGVDYFKSYIDGVTIQLKSQAFKQIPF